MSKLDKYQGPANCEEAILSELRKLNQSDIIKRPLSTIAQGVVIGFLLWIILCALLTLLFWALLIGGFLSVNPGGP